MTLHLAKGLEYPIAFICGLEEGIFPHSRSINSLDDSEIEEERRLMYVGVTRAKEKLYFTFARERRLFGTSEFSQSSRFINEAPKECLSGFYGGIDEKVKNDKRFISKRGIKRKISDYESDELIDIDGVQNVTVIRKLNTEEKTEEVKNHKSHFNAGDKVEHEKFGIGTVEQIFGEGHKQLLNINFQNNGKKLLDPKYAKLIKL